MFTSIFGNKSDHPLADMKSALALLEHLPGNDSYQALAELGGWVASLPDNFKPTHQLALLHLLDDAAQIHARRLTHDYFTPQELNKFQENRLWQVLHDWHGEISAAYYQLFDRFCGSAQSADSIMSALPKLSARAISAMTLHFKYTCAHYGKADELFWHKLAKFYLHAERLAYLDTPIRLYPGLAETATVKAQICRLLCWSSCGIHTLRPLHMHLTERIVNHFSAYLDMAAQPGASSTFCFDLERPTAPFNLQASAHASMRFVVMAPMQAELAELINKLGRSKVPENFNLGGSYPAELVREAALYLLDYSQSPPTRISARRTIQTGMNVVDGLARMFQRTALEPCFNGALPSYWEIENISASGFRALLPLQGTDSIRIGSLLGIQPEGVVPWGAAIVRRLMRDESQRLHIGAEMLAHQFLGVRLSESGGSFGEGQSALWLQPASEISCTEVQLLMKAGAFSAQRSLQTRLKGKNLLLLPERLLERGTDYDLANFRIIQRDCEAEQSD